MNSIIAELRNVPYAPEPNSAKFVLSTELPRSALITSAFGFVFSPQGMLLVNEDRGWDIPGGHIEAGEQPEGAMLREVLEETRIAVRSLGLVGYQHIHLEAGAPPDYPYPAPDSYQVFFLAEPISVSNRGESDGDAQARFWEIRDAVSLGETAFGVL